MDPRLLGSCVTAPLFVSDRSFCGYAVYVAIDARLAAPLPDGLSFEAGKVVLVP
ncbi:MULTISPECIES: hypothetical protein [unclassified Mesorhizobium]|uniref:hypothetical protein n=1 Tax=unclassified Mesorhizobium TaxID=325217 RepID=UPI002415DA84|nr:MULTISPECIES: hypothetical protein [unclassified Mesorhizobium]WFP65435.1 hypothetical protein QAZ47_13265 [Mesorhizobium sp. WSM4904]WFP78700.1 hypothetical protein QAZ22_13210 [Mesorhizobium sp. WSM4906]